MNAHIRDYFDSQPILDFGRGLMGVFLIVSVITAGWISNQITNVCLLLIASHVFWNGVRPLWHIVSGVGNDASKCAQELNEFQNASLENLCVLKSIDTSDGGSLMQLVATVARSGDRMTPERALDIHLNSIRQPYIEHSLKAATTAEQATMLGLGGSFIGLLSSLNGGADLAAGVGTMLLTTVAGVLGAFLLMGLLDVANKSVEQHISDLRIAASYALGIKRKQSDDDQFQSLFKRG